MRKISHDNFRTPNNRNSCQLEERPLKREICKLPSNRAISTPNSRNRRHIFQENISLTLRLLKKKKKNEILEKRENLSLFIRDVCYPIIGKRVV